MQLYASLCQVESKVSSIVISSIVQQGQCHSSSHSTTASMSGIVPITKGDEQQLLEAVATVGPIAAAVDATSNAFRVSSCMCDTVWLIMCPLNRTHLS